MLDPVDPVRVRICTDYAGEAIGTLLKIMRRDDASPDTRMRAAKEVLHRISGVLPPMEAKALRSNIFQRVLELQNSRALRRDDFARRRAEKAATRRQERKSSVPNQPIRR